MRAVEPVRAEADAAGGRPDGQRHALPLEVVPPAETRWSEARRPRRVREWSHAHWLVVAAVCIGACMGQLDASIVTIALPTLQRQFHAGIGAVTWVGLSYLLVLVASVAAVGRVSDMVGRKAVYVYGF